MLEVVENPKSFWNRWEWLQRILGWEGAGTQTYGIFFNVVVQVVPILWVGCMGDDPCLILALVNFHNLATRRTFHKP